MDNICTKWVEAVGTVKDIKKVEGKQYKYAVLEYDRGGRFNRIGIFVPEKYYNMVKNGMSVYITGNLRIEYAGKKRYVIYASEIRQMSVDDNAEGYVKAYLMGQITNMSYGMSGVVFDCVIQNDQKETFKCYAYGHNAFTASGICVPAEGKDVRYVKMECELFGNDFIKIMVQSIEEKRTVIKAVTDENDYVTEFNNVCENLQLTPKDLNILLFMFAKSKGLLPTHNDAEGCLVNNKQKDFIEYIRICEMAASTSGKGGGPYE